MVDHKGQRWRQQGCALPQKWNKPGFVARQQAFIYKWRVARYGEQRVMEFEKEKEEQLDKARKATEEECDMALKERYRVIATLRCLPNTTRWLPLPEKSYLQM